jgi:UDP-glucose 6-dehydrogenase
MTVEEGVTLVVGLGEVGGALAEILERKGPVARHDIQPVQIAGPINVMHICFPFKDVRQFESLSLSYIRRFNPSLVIINSTVTPGTTRAIARSSGAAVAYSPVRGKHVKMAEDLLHYDKFVAAPDAETARRAEEHLRAHGLKTRHVAKPETLELAKLAETTYFGMLIAYAQELNRYCEQVGADYSEAIKFFEEVQFLPRSEYFPGFIGGHCVMPNIEILLKILPAPLLNAVVDSNQRRSAELEAQSPPRKVSNAKP